MIKRTVYEAPDGTQFNTRKQCLTYEGKHVCPKCNGAGTTTERYNSYPPGLPDSGWAVDMKSRSLKCDLCQGEGFTEQEMKPVMSVTGYATK